MQLTESLKSIPKANNFIEIFKSQLPVLSSDKYTRMEVEAFITAQCLKFLQVNSPDASNHLLAEQFAEDVMETRLDWKPEDINMFFRFIRQRQDLPQCRIYGNKITGIKLSELITVYEDHRAEERESFINSQKEQEKAPMNLTVLHALNNVLNKFKPVESKPREETESEKLIKSWVAEFDKIYNAKYRDTKDSIRFIIQNGKKMNIDQWLKFKMEETIQE